MVKFIILITLAAYCLAAPLSNDIEYVPEDKTPIEKDRLRRQNGVELEPLSRQLLNNIFSMPFKTQTVLPSGQPVSVIHQGPFPIIFKPVLASDPVPPASASDLSIVVPMPTVEAPTSSKVTATPTTDAETTSKVAPRVSTATTKQSSEEPSTNAPAQSTDVPTSSTEATNPSANAFKSTTEAPTPLTDTRTSTNAASQTTKAQSSPT